MSVFCIGNIDIRDFEKYRNSRYLENAARTVTEYRGRYRVRGGQTKIIEGQPVLHRLVVIEFPSMEYQLSNDSMEGNSMTTSR